MNENGNVSENANANEVDYCHCVVLIDYYRYYFEHFLNDLSTMTKMAVVLLDDLVWNWRIFSMSMNDDMNPKKNSNVHRREQ